MMKIVFAFLSLFATSNLYSQNRDSLVSLIYAEKIDSAKIRRIFDVITNYGELEPTQAILYHQKILDLTRAKHDKVGEAVILSELGYTMAMIGNKERGTKMVLEALQIAEKTRNKQAIGIVYDNLGVCYDNDPPRAKLYYEKALKASETAGDYLYTCWELHNLSSIHSQLKQYDSAMYYTNRGYQLATAKNVAAPLPGLLLQLGLLQYRLGNKELALGYYRTALYHPFTQIDNRRLSSIYGYISSYYRAENQADSALYYANKSFEVSENLFYSLRLKPAGLLISLYKEKNSDSALKYAMLYMRIKDSVNNVQRLQQLQVLAIEENNRQLVLNEERNRNLQYAGIALGFVIFVILFMLLSHSVIASQKLIRFLGILALLIVFEFINLFLHPYLGKLTHHSPMLMLAIMVGIAAMLIPVHHQLEKWITHRLVEKNKKIRLEAAKKTIKSLSKTNLES